jgi:hypothetical protein
MIMQVSEPTRFVKWLPNRIDKLASKAFKRWIAADMLFAFGCGVGLVKVAMHSKEFYVNHNY